MCNKLVKLEYIAHNKSSYALRMIMSEIVLHSFSTCIQLILSSSFCMRKDWQCLVRIIKLWITRERIFLIVFFINCKFDHKNVFCKNCIGGFGLFVVISICV